uniref:Uncharacterized protein n=1 Tax=Timema genevievae TaxID=629358 RepID=A0A7R9PRA6_TIMGE|nr:unnamed protein product [Timema genevievae]
MDCVMIRGRRGTLHFVRFPTSEMGNFLVLAKSKGMATLVTTVFATGGGAFKFEDNFQTYKAGWDPDAISLTPVWNSSAKGYSNFSREVNLKLAKCDELDCLIRGMLYIEGNNPCECYYWTHPTEEERCYKRLYDFSNPYPFIVSTSHHPMTELLIT